MSIIFSTLPSSNLEKASKFSRSFCQRCKSLSSPYKPNYKSPYLSSTLGEEENSYFDNTEYSLSLSTSRIAHLITRVNLRSKFKVNRAALSLAETPLKVRVRNLKMRESARARYREGENMCPPRIRTLGNVRILIQ